MRKINDVIKYIRHRKLGENELYIYKESWTDMFVLQETNRAEQRGRNISYGHTIGPLLIEYNRAIKEYKFYNK